MYFIPKEKGFQMDIYIVGQLAKFQFLKEFTVNTKWENQSVSYFSAEDVLISWEERQVLEHGLQIHSKQIPVGTNLYFPQKAPDFYPSTCGKILVFDEIPFASQSLLEEIESISSKNPFIPVELVLYENHRSALESDISTELDALKEAAVFYQRKEYKTCHYTWGSEKLFLLFHGRPQKQRLKQQALEKIHDLEEDLCFFSSEYDAMYEDYLKDEFCENPSFLNNLTRYEPSLRNQNLVFVYCQRVDSHLSSHQGIFDSMTETYCDMMSDYAPWDLKQDGADLGVSLKKYLMNSLMTQSASAVFTGVSSLDYLNYLMETKIDLQFKQAYISFFRDKGKELMLNHATTKIHSIRGLLHAV